MIENQNNTPFAELPASLVQEVLDRTDEISKTLLETFEHVKNRKPIWREELIEKGIVQKSQIFLLYLSQHHVVLMGEWL